MYKKDIPTAATTKSTSIGVTGDLALAGDFRVAAHAAVAAAVGELVVAPDRAGRGLSGTLAARAGTALLDVVLVAGRLGQLGAVAELIPARVGGGGNGDS